MTNTATKTKQHHSGGGTFASTRALQLYGAILVLLIACVVFQWVSFTDECNDGTIAKRMGYVTCEGQKLAGARVVLMEHDDSELDDFISETTTDSNGYFSVAGVGTDSLLLPSIEPYLRIEGTCRGHLVKNKLPVVCGQEKFIGTHELI